MVPVHLHLENILIMENMINRDQYTVALRISRPYSIFILGMHLTPPGTKSSGL
jgi:hypothetical protein